MKKYLSLAVLAICTLILISWGFVGHQTVGAIAEAHLTPKAKQAALALLTGQHLADVAPWADEARNQPEFKQTTPWHYINVELGLNYNDFASTIKSQGASTLYAALLNCETALKSATTTPQQKAVALKFIIHFVGDAHQPMHVSRAEDKGGNSIQVQFNGRGTNIHSLWDSGLINKQGSGYAKMAKDYDTATPAEIKQWQNDDVMKWLWESYQISTKIYADAPTGSVLDEVYYKANILVVEKRIDMAGIRLAGVLNDIFKGATITKVNTVDVPKIAIGNPIVVDAADIAKHLGQVVTVNAQAFNSRDMGSMVLVNIGAAYPNQLFTVVLRGDAKALGNGIDGKTISVTGEVMDYKGKPKIVVTDINQISLEAIVNDNAYRGRKGG